MKNLYRVTDEWAVNWVRASSMNMAAKAVRAFNGTQIAESGETDVEAPGITKIELLVSGDDVIGGLE